MSEHAINYSVLNDESIFNSKEPPLDRWTNWLPRPLRSPIKLLLLPLFIAAIFGMLIIITICILVAFAISAIAGVGACIPVVILLAWMYKRQRRIDKGRRRGISDFARQNNWDYGPAGNLVKNFNHGKDIKSAEENRVNLFTIKGKLQEHDFELLVGWKAIGDNRLELTTPTLYIKSRKMLPEAILLSMTITDGFPASKIFVGYDKVSSVSLEGDFDKWLRLYVPEGKHIDAMSLIGPDLMLTAKEFIKEFTIQMSGKAFSLRPALDSIPSKQMFINIFTAAQKLLHETDY